jgi:predicted MFS family arabinose efflux permease
MSLQRLCEGARPIRLSIGQNWRLRFDDPIRMLPFKAARTAIGWRNASRPHGVMGMREPAFGTTMDSAPAEASDSKVPLASWYALAVLTSIHIFSQMDRVALSILLQLIKTDLHLSDAQLGLLSGLAFALFYALLGVPLAWLADRTSRLRLISVCLVLWSAMTALGGLARNYSQFFVSRVGVGVGEAGCLPPSYSLISDYFPRTKRALGISLFNTGAAIGMVGGMTLTGYLGEHYGWRAALQIIGLAGLPIALITILTLREPARPKSDRPAESMMESLWVLLRRPTFMHLSIAYALSHVATQGYSQWAPSFLMRSFAMKPAEIGAWLGGIGAAGGMLGVVSGGFLASWLVPRDQRWEIWLPAGSVAICTPLYIVMVLSPFVWLNLLTNGVIAFLTGVAGIATATVQSFTEPYRRATAVAIMMFLLSFLSSGIGPYLIGLTSDFLAPGVGGESLRYALLVAGVMLFWSLAHYVLAMHSAAHDRVM